MDLRRCVVSFLLAAAVASACGESESRQCRVGDDCASGMCQPDGSCVPSGSESGPSPTADASPDASDGASADSNVRPDAGVAGCVPSKDGVVTREEVPVKAGLRATYRVAEDVDLSTAGTPRPDGTRAWDLSVALAGDESVLVETVPLAGTWYAAKFSGASYAAKLRASSDLLGVFETTPASLLLRGVVSPDDGVYRTELAYDPPVSVLAFPLAANVAWTTSTTVRGFASGVPTTYSEKYESQVDARGVLETPLGTFDVLRVRVLLTRTVGFAVTRVRTFAFVTECYGTVATITSRDNENDVEFTRAAEVRRIAP